MRDNKKKLIVSQSNKLVEARYSLTVGEQRLILSMISMISPEDADFRKYELKVSDLARFLNLSNKNLYEQMEVIVQRLMGRVLHIPEPTGYLKTHWVSSARYHKESGIISLSFDPELRPYLLQLKEQFTQYQLTIAAQFQSAYTIRIYGLLKQYEPIGHREFMLAELRAILGVEDNEYPQYKEFKRRVIDQAKKELDSQDAKTSQYKSDISFELEEKRESRKVNRLRFVIIKHKLAYQDELVPGETPAWPESPLLLKLKYYGIADKDACKFLREKSEEEINTCLAVYEKRLQDGKIKDPNGGYLATLLRADTDQETPYRQEQTRKAEEKRDAAARQRQARAAEESAKATEAQQTEFFLAALPPAELEQLRNDFLAEHQNNITVMRLYLRHGFDSKTVQAVFRGYVKQRVDK